MTLSDLIRELRQIILTRPEAAEDEINYKAARQLIHDLVKPEQRLGDEVV